VAEFNAVVSTLRAGQPVALLVYDRLSGQVIVTIVPDPS
jgi:hypothetical protein